MKTGNKPFISSINYYMAVITAFERAVYLVCLLIAGFYLFLLITSYVSALSAIVGEVKLI